MMTTTTYGSTSTIYIGQIDLSMYDAVQKQLVWRGTASKTLDPKAKPEKKQKNLTKAVTTIEELSAPAEEIAGFTLCG